MAIVTVDEVKSILQLTDNTYDESIRALIPMVQDDVTEYCSNHFDDMVIYRHSGSQLEFVRGSTNTSSTQADYITDADDYFTTSGFSAGMDIFVSGGSNQGHYTLSPNSSEITSAQLTLTCTGELVDQAQTTYHRWPGYIAISRVKWPRGLKLYVAKMIWHLIKTAQEGDVKSESIDDYSVTFAGEHAYPQRVVAGLKPYRKVVLV